MYPTRDSAPMPQGYDARQQEAAQYQDKYQAAQNSPMAKGPSVIEQLNQQEKVIVGAHSIFDQLIDRLLPILGPVGGNPAKENAPRPPTSKQLSQRIPLHTRGVEMLIQRMQEVIGRIEL